MGSQFTIHANPSLRHQVELAENFRKGLQQHGHRVCVTDQATADGDTHVVLGPHFALQRWRFARTLYIDRGYWGDPDSVSIHWLQDGEKHFTRIDAPRRTPQLKDWRTSQRIIYLCDYRMRPEGEYHAYRRHPAEPGTAPPLMESLEGFGIARGRRTTALIDASIEGLVVHSDDPHSPVAEISGKRAGREQWLNHLAWHNWSRSEIENGEFLDAIGDRYKAD